MVEKEALFQKERIFKEKEHDDKIEKLKSDNRMKMIKEKEFEQKLIQKERETNEILVKQQEICDEYEQELRFKEAEVREL